VISTLQVSRQDLSLGIEKELRKRGLSSPSRPSLRTLRQDIDRVFWLSAWVSFAILTTCVYDEMNLLIVSSAGIIILLAAKAGEIVPDYDLPSLGTRWSHSKKEFVKGAFTFTILFLIIVTASVAALTGPLFFFLGKFVHLEGNLKLTFLESLLLSVLTIGFFLTWCAITRLRIGGMSSTALAYWSSAAEMIPVILIYLLFMSDIATLESENHLVVPQLLREWLPNIVSWISLLLVPLGLSASIDTTIELSLRLKDVSIGVVHSFLYESRLALPLILTSLNIFSFFSTGFWIISSNLGFYNFIAIFLGLCGIPACLLYRSNIQEILNVIRSRTRHLKELEISAFEDKIRSLGLNITVQEEKLRRAFAFGDLSNYLILAKKYKSLFFAIPFFIMILSFGILLAINLLVVPSEAIAILARKTVQSELEVLSVRICFSYLLANITTGIICLSFVTLKQEFNSLLESISKTVEEDFLLLVSRQYTTSLDR